MRMKTACFVSVCLFLTGAAYGRYVIFDTRQAGPDISFRYYADNYNSRQGSWHPETYVVNGTNAIYFHTCAESLTKFEESQRENWLVMPKIAIGSASKLTIEAGFTIGKCDASNNREKACQKEVILRAYPLSQSQILPDKNWHNQSKWEDIGPLSALSPYDKADSNMHVLRFEYKPTDSAVYFGLQDQGTCFTLHYLKVMSDSPPPANSSPIDKQNDWFMDFLEQYGLPAFISLVLLVVLITAVAILCFEKKDPQDTVENGIRMSELTKDGGA